MQQWLQVEWDYWEWQHGTITQADVLTAIGDCKPGRTCGADGVVSEMWQAAVAADPHIAACLAWARNQRLQKMAPVQQARHPLPAHVRTHACDASACAQCTDMSSAVNSDPRSRVTRPNSDQPADPPGGPQTARKSDPWKTVQVQLLPKQAAPTEFRLLRPINLLVTSCKALSRAFLRKAEPHDTGSDGQGKADMAMQGFRRGFQCAELIHTLRAVVEKATQWSVPVYISQVDFARAYDSGRHPAIRRAMLRGGEPPLVVAGYI